MLTKRQKQNVIKEHAKHDADTGSTEVQIALLSKKIKFLADHLKKNPKDTHSRRGLLVMVGKRRRFLQIIKREDEKQYVAIVKKLAIES
jgi:small subunit ribosomal protein S15